MTDHLREPKGVIGVIVSDRRRRVVGDPFHVQPAEREAIDQAEAKRARKAAKAKESTHGEA